MIINTMSCIYAKNGVQNTSSIIYIYAETKISGIETIHIATNVLKKESNNIEVNNNVIFNSHQVFVSQNTTIYYKPFETAINKDLICTSNTFQNKKSQKSTPIKQFDAKKSNSKATTKYKPIPPFNNSPFGWYNNGKNYIVVSTINTSLNKIKKLSISYISITKNAEQPISSITKEHSQQFIFSVEKHFFKYTFSLPPPSFC